MSVSFIGNAGNSAPIVYNKIPYLEIAYPIAHIANDISTHRTFNTSQDVIKAGLNFYSVITKITMREDSDIIINNKELSELISLLKGGVIYNGPMVHI